MEWPLIHILEIQVLPILLVCNWLLYLESYQILNFFSKVIRSQNYSNSILQLPRLKKGLLPSYYDWLDQINKLHLQFWIHPILLEILSLHRESTRKEFFLLFFLLISIQPFSHWLFECLNYLIALELDQLIFFQCIFCEVHTIYFLNLSLMFYGQFIDMHVYFLVFLFQKYRHHLLEILHHQ